MTDTFTFLCHGTGHHEEGKKHSLLTPLSETIADKESFRIINGPGGQPTRQDSSNPMPGTYRFNPITGEKTAKASFIPERLVKFVATIAGYGVDDNLIEMLDAVIFQTPRPQTINLIGYSRGADTTLRFANLLYDFLPDIKVNIFAIDSVAGPGRGFDKSATRIPPNVKHYVGLLALHEEKLGFDPQDLSRLSITDPQKTRMDLLPFPGSHGDLASLSEKNPAAHSSSEAVSDIAVRYLRAWGTDVSERPDYIIRENAEGASRSYRRKPNPAAPSDVALLKKFTLMVQANREGKLGRFSRSRFFMRHIIDYSPILPRYFVNTYHMKLFANVYPMSFAYIKNPTSENRIQASDEFQQMKETQPEIWRWMVDTPQTKQPIFFDPEHDSLTGNYQKMVSAIHHYRIMSKGHNADELADARALIRETRAIITSEMDSQEKENRIELLATRYQYEHSGSPLSQALKDRFVAKPMSETRRVIHHLKAAQRVNIFEYIVHGIQRILSSDYRQYYHDVHTALDSAIHALQTNEGDLRAALDKAYDDVQSARDRLSNGDQNALNDYGLSDNMLISLDRVRLTLPDSLKHTPSTK